MFGIDQKVEKAARKAAAFSAGGLFAAVGIGFLTVAAWLVLSELRSDMFAALVIAGVYLGLSACAFGWGMIRHDRHRPTDFATRHGGLSPAQLMAVSFLQGLEQGRQARR